MSEEIQVGDTIIYMKPDRVVYMSTVSDIDRSNKNIQYFVSGYNKSIPKKNIARVVKKSNPNLWYDSISRPFAYAEGRPPLNLSDPRVTGVNRYGGKHRKATRKGRGRRHRRLTRRR